MLIFRGQWENSVYNILFLQVSLSPTIFGLLDKFLILSQVQNATPGLTGFNDIGKLK